MNDKPTLSQTTLEAFSRARDHKVDVTLKPPRPNKADFNFRVEKTETDATGSIPAAREDSEPTIFHSSMSDVGRVRKPNVGKENRHSSDEKTYLDSHHENAQIIPVGSAPTDYQSALLRIINSAANDPRQLRWLVYELARENLNKQAGQGRSALAPGEIRESVLALETAIARVEIDLHGARARICRLLRLEPGPEHLDDDLVRANPVGVGSVVSFELAGPQTAGLVQHDIWPRRRPRPEGNGSLRVGSSTALAERPAVEIVYPERDKPDVVRVRRVESGSGSSCGRSFN